MKLIYAINTVALCLIAGASEDSPITFHCQGSYSRPDWRDQALDNLSKWCDAGNKLGPSQQARFNVHNTTAFICSYKHEITCNKTSVDRFVGGIKAVCPRDDQGGTAEELTQDVTYGWSSVPRPICGDWLKVVYEEGYLDPLPFPHNIPN